MNLVFDVGNTNIKTGLFENGKLRNSWRMSTDIKKTADEFGVQIDSFFKYLKYDLDMVDGVIISSVMPPINYTIEHMCLEYFKKAPIFVGPGIKTGIRLRYDNMRELGSDRICNAVAAAKIYGGPCIMVDFGTATSFGVLNEQNDFVGGAICPGIRTSMNALVERTSKLPSIEIVKPQHVVGTSTVQGLQSGILYGYVGLVDNIIRKMQQETGYEAAPVIGTGGMSDMIAAESEFIGEINPTLTLQGLNILYELNA